MQEKEKKHHPLVELAKETVEYYVQEGKVFQPSVTHPEMAEKAGVFVSLKKQGELRGCIGTFNPTKDSIAEEIVANAVNSATRDPRFPPVQLAELPDLEYSVDVLSQPEFIENSDDLDPKKYGVIVESGWRRGLLLPDLEGVDTAQLQIDICRRKAGILPDEPIALYRFEVKRYT
ncbi:MAG: AmmeMemoRadiSam system protein A [Chloroflexota bacterium]|nr:AmmeMemoRadiSam system protein A [Chloroflexota bacterium]